jgi:cyclic pyranopterin phosphate synthase
VTDRCDLACVYCRPGHNDGYLRDRVNLEDWKEIAWGLVQAGVRRVRLTGGEPLLYRDLLPLVRFLSTLPFEDLALTTNATQLEELAKPLRDAGLHRLNVSLDSLHATRFSRLTRGGDLKAVLAGLEAARQAGFQDIKLNTVVVRGENDDEIEAIIDFAWERGFTPRFLEVMPIGEGAGLRAHVVPARELMTRIAHRLEPGVPARDTARGPAVYRLRLGDPTHRVGFITGTSDTFCEGCDRLRVSARGEIRPCLATDAGIVRPARIERDAVAQAVDSAWEAKPDGRAWRGCTEATAADISMRAVGG